LIESVQPIAKLSIDNSIRGTAPDLRDLGATDSTLSDSTGLTASRSVENVGETSEVEVLFNP